jgi:hypothetical protein
LRLKRFSVTASDLQQLELLSDLHLDFPEDIDSPTSSVSRVAFASGEWLPALQSLDLTVSNIYDQDIALWIASQSESRGILFTVDAPGASSMAFFENRLPDAGLVLTQTL